MSRDVARRFLSLRHFLAPARSLGDGHESVARVIDYFGSIQFDPLEVAGRNHDLVLLARVAGYRREWTDNLLYVQRRYFEAHNKGLSILPIDELPPHRVTWDNARRRHEATFFHEHRQLVDALLDRINREGPLSTKDVSSGDTIDWYWGRTGHQRAVLEALAESGILAIARREGNRRYYDLAERVWPDELISRPMAAREQYRHRLLSRYRAHGLLGASGSTEVWLGTSPHHRYNVAPDDLAPGAEGRRDLLQELLRRGDVMAVRVAGLRQERYVVRHDLEILARAEREIAHGLDPGGEPPNVALLAPLDPLMWDRQLIRELYGVDYVWEVYVPAAKRRWGYYVLPIHYGDRIVGRIEPRIDRASDALDVRGLWWEEGFRPNADDHFAGALADALLAQRDFAGLARVSLTSVEPKAFATRLRRHLGRREV